MKWDDRPACALALKPASAGCPNVSTTCRSAPTRRAKVASVMPVTAKCGRLPVDRRGAARLTARVGVGAGRPADAPPDRIGRLALSLTATPESARPFAASPAAHRLSTLCGAGGVLIGITSAIRPFQFPALCQPRSRGVFTLGHANGGHRLRPAARAEQTVVEYEQHKQGIKRQDGRPTQLHTSAHAAFLVTGSHSLPLYYLLQM
eukprot:scaffold20203_cov127-Isochrysis_galbana.AAC.2